VSPRAAAPAAKRRRLDRTDYNAPTLRVARDLLGKFIVRRRDGRELSAMITEVEAYKGPRDRASHAAGGRRTARVEPLYRDGGTVYVYFVYGMHWLLNFSTAGAGKPEGVLIRAGRAAASDGDGVIGGPGRVTRYLAIDKRLDGADATRSKELWLEDRGVRIPERRVRKGPRVGVDYAGPYWAARPWRYSVIEEAGPAGTRADRRARRPATRPRTGATDTRDPDRRTRRRDRPAA
jgi:DNA-3-methyladenine glycosylase